jgi:hypothetical protein
LVSRSQAIGEFAVDQDERDAAVAPDLFAQAWFVPR